MLRRTKIATACSAALTLSTMVIAQQGQMGTAQEAKALLERAIPVVQADNAAAFAKFNKGEDGFKDRDLYVFCFDSGNGTINSGPATLIGHDVRALKDKN